MKNLLIILLISVGFAVSVASATPLSMSFDTK